MLSVLVEDEPGVLARISSLLSGRGYNIHSLNVANTMVQGLSRITITVSAPRHNVEQAVKQIEGCEECLAVLQHNRADSLEREVVLVKLNTEPSPEQRDEMTEGEVLMLQHERRQALLGLSNLFEAKVADVGSRHVILQLTSWPKRVEAFVKLLAPYDVVEVARSGAVALPRSKVALRSDLPVEEEDAVMDLADLPPS